MKSDNKSNACTHTNRVDLTWCADCERATPETMSNEDKINIYWMIMKSKTVADLLSEESFRQIAQHWINIEPEPGFIITKQPFEVLDAESESFGKFNSYQRAMLIKELLAIGDALFGDE